MNEQQRKDSPERIDLSDNTACVEQATKSSDASGKPR
jgi:hypothetical protein